MTRRPQQNRLFMVGERHSSLLKVLKIANLKEMSFPTHKISNDETV